MDIEGLGDAVLETLLNKGFISKISDIYQIDYEKIAELDGMGKKTAENMQNAIEKSKQNDLSKLLFAFGIRHIGQKASKLLSDRFLTLDNIISATKEEVLSIEGFGGIMAKQNFVADFIVFNLIQRNIYCFSSGWNVFIGYICFYFTLLGNINYYIYCFLY